MQSIHPVSPERHSGKRWERFNNYLFTANDSIYPLVVHELPKAVMSMPIGFVMVEDRFTLVSVHSLEAGKNYYVSRDGKWLARYIPEGYLCHPFLLLNSNEEREVLCINEDYLSKGGEEDEPFFDDEGKPTETIQKVLQFLSEHSARRVLTQTLCAKLQSLELITPWQIKINTDKGQRNLEGLYGIDEEKFNALDADTLFELKQAGALPVIYCQMLSTIHLNSLAKLSQAHNSQNNALAELQLDSMNEGPGLNFDNF